jgi:hypothetical protein
VNSVEVTLGGENSLEQKTPKTGGENLVKTQHEENITSVLQIEENNLFQTNPFKKTVDRVTSFTSLNILAEDVNENGNSRNTPEVITAMDCDDSTIIETIENIICDPSDAKLPPSWRWLLIAMFTTKMNRPHSRKLPLDLVM